MNSRPIRTRLRTLSTKGLVRPQKSTFIMAGVLLAVGGYLFYPVMLLFVFSFNTAPEVFIGTREWGLGNWRAAFDHPLLVRSLFNSVLIWFFTVIISLPVATGIAWILARTRIPFSESLEFMFWISYMVPSLATTLGWITLLDPSLGLFNTAARWLPFVDEGPFNIFSVAGIVWANVMANGISVKVMLLTPFFRNMDASLEEAGRVSGASNVATMWRITIPLMIAPITLIFALQLLRVFQSFETELLLGMPFGFFVYSTMIYDLLRFEPPRYGQAIVLASLTMLIIVFLIPLQRWILERRRYTTITAGFRPGLINIGRWGYLASGAIWALIVLLTLAPVAGLVLGSFMARSGFFHLNKVFVISHWQLVFNDPVFIQATVVTLTLGVMAAFFSPLLFSLLAYILVRTRWRGRVVLDMVIWSSGAIPGILSGLGLLVVFLGTPGLSIMFGTIWALLLVVIISGNTTGVNITKGAFVQIGHEMEDAARIAGAGWTRTYVRIWIPLIMRTLILLAVLNFTSAVGATSSIILLASRDTRTLSILALEFRMAGANPEVASVIAIILMVLTVGLVIPVRAWGSRAGVRHN